jgi:hypothetical protein
MRYNTEMYRWYIDTDLVTCTRVKILKRDGHVMIIRENRIPKGILVTSLGRRGPAGKPRNRWEDEVWRDAVTLFNAVFYCRAGARRASNWKNETEESGTRKRGRITTRRRSRRRRKWRQREESLACSYIQNRGTKYIIKNALSSGFKILHPHKILITVTIPEIREQKAIRTTKTHNLQHTFFWQICVRSQICYCRPRQFKFQDFPLLTTEYNQQN